MIMLYPQVEFILVGEASQLVTNIQQLEPQYSNAIHKVNLFTSFFENSVSDPKTD